MQMTDHLVLVDAADTRQPTRRGPQRPRRHAHQGPGSASSLRRRCRPATAARERMCSLPSAASVCEARPSARLDTLMTRTRTALESPCVLGSEAEPNFPSVFQRLLANHVICMVHKEYFGISFWVEKKKNDRGDTLSKTLFLGGNVIQQSRYFAWISLRTARNV